MGRRGIVASSARISSVPRITSRQMRRSSGAASTPIRRISLAPILQRNQSVGARDTREIVPPKALAPMTFLIASGLLQFSLKV